MAEVTVTVRGERLTVEKLVHRQMGRYVPGLVEATYERNHGLGRLGIFPPVGTTFVIPDVTKEQDEASVTPIRLVD